MKQMIPFLIALICLILVILEGTLASLSLPFVKSDWMIVSHFAFVFLIYVTIFFEKDYTYYAIALSVIVSLIIDVVYTDVIGVYIFAYTFTLYVIRVLMKVLQANVIIAMLMTLLGVSAVDMVVSFLYQILQIHQAGWDFYWVNRLVPTVIWNLLIGLLLYVIFAKRLSKWSTIKFDRAD
ncbi:rod shape-determining protein MreD [Gracilibacillus alcaliphilus]|uniref:rod shape-determining protein MreD n=1 Tax=Gracilibacillus alcaliphilus TaxID=1401441 RepID=UPI00195B5A7E|nr:rod shape-determining protein MreD [Gracilibacillus alcaliphilus]MBM7678558.1 rod shape-determining protein MreD [Gracilibacillus alcaliphilus]